MLVRSSPKGCQANSNSWRPRYAETYREGSPGLAHAARVELGIAGGIPAAPSGERLIVSPETPDRRLVNDDLSSSIA